MAIRQFLDGIEHHFEKGGKYERGMRCMKPSTLFSIRLAR